MATLSRKGAQMASSVKPVLYSIRKGELVVSRGEIVTRETQLKLQSLFGRSQEFLQLWYVGGLFLVSILLCPLGALLFLKQFFLIHTPLTEAVPTTVAAGALASSRRSIIPSTMLAFP